VFDLLSWQGLRFLLRLPPIVELRQGLEPACLNLSRISQLVLSHTHWQTHQRKTEHDGCFLGIFLSHWSIARTTSESQSMHWLILHADQLIGEAAQMTANIKIWKTGAEVASCAESILLF
jgi:hypothetical protein